MTVADLGSLPDDDGSKGPESPTVSVIVRDDTTDLRETESLASEKAMGLRNWVQQQQQQPDWGDTKLGLVTIAVIVVFLVVSAIVHFS